MTKVTVVIASYKNDLGWLNYITNPDVNIIVIKKGNALIYERAEETIIIKNVGMCDHSFLYYISHFYDFLEDYTIFLQDYPFDHYRDTISFINSKEYLRGFKPLAEKFIPIPPGEGTDNFIESFLDITFQGVIFPGGAQYSVPKYNIISKPKKFWIYLYNELPWNENSFIPWWVERSWLFLYNPHIKPIKALE